MIVTGIDRSHRHPSYPLGTRGDNIDIYARREVADACMRFCLAIAFRNAWFKTVKSMLISVISIDF